MTHVPIGLEGGHPTVALRVGGVPCRFYLDTGADVSVVTPGLAERLALERIGTHEGGVAGGRRLGVDLVALENVELAGRSESLTPVAVVDFVRLLPDLGELDGVLGSDFLSRSPFTIDYPGGAFGFEDETTLRRRAQHGVTAPLRVENARTPYLTVRIDDRLDVDYKLDTGAARTQVRLVDLDATGFDRAALVPVEKHGLGGAYTVYPLKMGSLSAGPGLAVTGLDADAQDGPLGFVGTNYLRHFALTLDYASGRAIFARPGSRASPSSERDPAGR